jgi:hypothetical protein
LKVAKLVKVVRVVRASKGGRVCWGGEEVDGDCAICGSSKFWWSEGSTNWSAVYPSSKSSLSFCRDVTLDTSFSRKAVYHECGELAIVALGKVLSCILVPVSLHRTISYLLRPFDI